MDSNLSTIKVHSSIGATLGRLCLKLERNISGNVGKQSLSVAAKSPQVCWTSIDDTFETGRLSSVGTVCVGFVLRRRASGSADAQLYISVRDLLRWNSGTISSSNHHFDALQSPAGNRWI